MTKSKSKSKSKSMSIFVKGCVSFYRSANFREIRNFPSRGSLAVEAGSEKCNMEKFREGSKMFALWLAKTRDVKDITAS